MSKSFIGLFVCVLLANVLLSPSALAGPPAPPPPDAASMESPSQVAPTEAPLRQQPKNDTEAPSRFLSGLGQVGGGLVGEWIGWDGSLLATIGGVVLGALVFGALASALDTLAGANTQDVGTLLFVLGMPTAGAAGYQLFADWPTGSNARLAPKATMFRVIHFEF
jgi:hypothetical protein